MWDDWSSGPGAMPGDTLRELWSMLTGEEAWAPPFDSLDPYRRERAAELLLHQRTERGVEQAAAAPSDNAAHCRVDVHSLWSIPERLRSVLGDATSITRELLDAERVGRFAVVHLPAGARLVLDLQSGTAIEITPIQPLEAPGGT